MVDQALQQRGALEGVAQARRREERGDRAEVAGLVERDRALGEASAACGRGASRGQRASAERRSQLGAGVRGLAPGARWRPCRAPRAAWSICLEGLEQPALLALEGADALAVLLDRAAQRLELGLAGVPLGGRREPGGDHEDGGGGGPPASHERRPWNSAAAEPITPSPAPPATSAALAPPLEEGGLA